MRSAKGIGSPLSALALFCLLAACAHGPPRPDEGKVREFASHGYTTEESYPTTTTLLSWANPDGTFDAAVTVPSKAASFPLVIYLPALGEGRDAGAVWRMGWAQAGYAALAIQPLLDDATAWSSDRARAGEFAALARGRYAGKIMAARVDALAAALTDLRRRHDEHEAPFDRIDLSRIAVTGYDLGAYTAMAIAGEHIRDAQPPAVPIQPHAVIAFSPYADFSGAGFATRYGDMRLPVLLVTSDTDADPLGVVTSPSVREAPFQYMPAGDKYLLRLWGVPHRTLAGTLEPEAGDEARAERSPAGEGQGGSRGGGQGRRRGAGLGPMGAGPPGSGEAATTLTGTRLTATAQAIDVAAIRSVTTAFLDAYVKGDPVAREWLARDASRWIGEHGELRKK